MKYRKRGLVCPENHVHKMLGALSILVLVQHCVYSGLKSCIFDNDDDLLLTAYYKEAIRYKVMIRDRLYRYYQENFT